MLRKYVNLPEGSPSRRWEVSLQGGLFAADDNDDGVVKAGNKYF